MHFQFTTTYTRDHAHLEDFQPHRRIFGVCKRQCGYLRMDVNSGLLGHWYYGLSRMEG